MKNIQGKERIARKKDRKDSQGEVRIVSGK